VNQRCGGKPVRLRSGSVPDGTRQGLGFTLGLARGSGFRQTLAFLRACGASSNDCWRMEEHLERGFEALKS